MEGTDDRILAGPKIRSDRDDEKILSSVCSQTTGSMVSIEQTVTTVAELKKSSGNEVRKVRSFRVLQRVS